MEGAETVPSIEVQLGITIIKEEMLVTYRQVMTVADQENVPAALAYLQAKLSDGGVTGKAYVNMTQGGTNSIVTEEVGRIPIGSDLEKQVDACFGR